MLSLQRKTISHNESACSREIGKGQLSRWKLSILNENCSLGKTFFFFGNKKKDEV